MIRPFFSCAGQKIFSQKYFAAAQRTADSLFPPSGLEFRRLFRRIGRCVSQKGLAGARGRHLGWCGLFSRRSRAEREENSSARMRTRKRQPSVSRRIMTIRPLRLGLCLDSQREKGEKSRRYHLSTPNTFFFKN